MMFGKGEGKEKSKDFSAEIASAKRERLHDGGLYKTIIIKESLVISTAKTSQHELLNLRRVLKLSLELMYRQTPPPNMVHSITTL